MSEAQGNYDDVEIEIEGVIGEIIEGIDVQEDPAMGSSGDENLDLIEPDYQLLDLDLHRQSIMLERSCLDSWIVPYNSTLLRMFNAHINVEFCHSVKSIKYICKYVTKGSDMALFERRRSSGNPLNPNDEIEIYQSGRYINANESFWKLFKFEIHERYPPVQHLHVHLENGQRVIFRPDQAVQRSERPPRTTLTAFFDLCRNDEFARTLLYPEVPRYYTWDARSKCFRRRLRGTVHPVHNDIRSSDTIGRVYTVSPTWSDCFFLRLLLMAVRGPTSFRSLLVVDGFQCASYREACQMLGLLKADDHWIRTLEEAEASRLPQQMRQLFAVILTICQPSNPTELWERYKESLSEDVLLMRRRRNPDLHFEYDDAIFNESLILLEDLCLSLGNKCLSELGLCSPNRIAFDIQNNEIERETNYDPVITERFFLQNFPLLNDEQRSVFETITQAISRDEGGCYFLQAAGGTGKTFLINLILAWTRSRKKIIVAVASSGIAATCLTGGRTAHSAFKIPLDINRCDQPICNITRNSAKGQMLRQCSAIIWDEATMSHKKSIEAVDRSLRDLRNDEYIFGRVVVLFCGDFRQTLPLFS